MNKRHRKKYLEALKLELNSYHNKGVQLMLSGRPSSAYNIIKAHRVAETKATYMRDYITDENGALKAINFSRISTNKKSGQ